MKIKVTITLPKITEEIEIPPEQSAYGAGIAAMEYALAVANERLCDRLREGDVPELWENAEYKVEG
jgi:hypothetical protein